MTEAEIGKAGDTVSMEGREAQEGVPVPEELNNYIITFLTLLWV